MKAPKDTKELTTLLVVILLSGVFLFFVAKALIKYIKSKKPDLSINNGGDNPDNYYNDLHNSGVQLNQNQYTLATVDSTGRIQPTDQVIKLLEGLEKELYPNFYTSDDAVLSYMELCKTVGDLAFLNKLWNGTISEKHSGDLLLPRAKQKLSDSNYLKLGSYLNSLPTNV